MVFLDNWVPEEELADQQVWNPVPGFDEDLKQVQEQEQEKATLEMYPAVADVKRSADIAQKQVTLQEAVEERRGGSWETMASSGYTGPDIASPVRIAKNVGKAAAEIATASPYAMAVGVGRAGDLPAKFFGKEDGFGLEEQIKTSLKENSVGRWMERQAEKSPLATEFMADMPSYAMAGGLAHAGFKAAGSAGAKFLPMLTDGRFARFAPGLQNIAKSDFVKGMINPKNLSQDVLHGSWKMYAGRWGAVAGEALTADWFTRPLWYDRAVQQKGDKEYVSKTGLVAMNVGTTAALSMFGTLPLMKAIKQNQYNAGRKLFKGISEIAKDVGFDTAAAIKNAQWDFRGQLAVYREARLKHNPYMSAEERELLGVSDKTELPDISFDRMLTQTKKKFNKFMGYDSKIDFNFGDEQISTFEEIFLSNPNPMQVINPFENTKTVKDMVDKGIISVQKKGDRIVDIRVKDPGANVEVVKPLRKGAEDALVEDIRLVKYSVPRKSAKSLEDKIASMIASQKSRLVKDVEANEFMCKNKTVISLDGSTTTVPDADSLSNILPIFDGGLPEELQNFITNYIGHGRTEGTLRNRAILQSLKRATEGSEEAKALVTFGTRVNKAVNSMERKVAGICTDWSKVIESGDNAAANDFFKLYSTIRNKGYEVSKFVVDDKGMRAALDMSDAHTFAMYVRETGEDPDVIRQVLSGEADASMLKRPGLVEAIETATDKGTTTTYQFYAPALHDTGVAATITNETAQRLMQQWARTQEGLYGVFQHSEKIYELGKNYKKYHVQTANIPTEDLWFMYGSRSGKFDEMELLGVYPSRADAMLDRKGWVARGIPEENLRMPEQGKDAIRGFNAEQAREFDRIITGYHEGRQAGHWQGNLYDQGVESLAEVYQGVLEESRHAIRQNVRAATSKIFDALELTGRSSLREDYEKILTGQVPKADWLDDVDNLMNRVVDRVYRWTRKTPKEIEPELAKDIWQAAPRELRSKSRNFITSLSKDLSLAMYSGGNIAAATTNVLSILQSTPMAMQWYNKFPNETVNEWVLRTGIKMADGQAPAIVSDTALGLSFMKKMATKEGRAEVFRMAEEAGVMTNELKSLQQALDPLRNTPKGLLKKTIRGTEGLLEGLSGPVFATEEFSRLAAFGVGYEVATKRFKMAPEQAKSWAAGFVDTAMGAYDLFGRPGYSNSTFLKHFFMFTTYMNNYITRNIDMLEGGAYKAIGKSNLLSAILFGPKSVPFMQQVLEATDWDDEFSLSAAGDLGLSAYTGLAFASMADFNVLGLTRGLERPIMYSVIKDSFLFMEDVIKDLFQTGDVDMQYILESASTHLPVILGRRIPQALLGYKVTMNHNLLTELKQDVKEEILAGARLLSGLSTTQERLFTNWERYSKEAEQAKQLGAQQNKRSLLTRMRSAPYGLYEKDESKAINTIIGDMLRNYGYDADALSSAFLQTLESANAGQGQRIIQELMKSDKYNPIVFMILNNLQRSTREGFMD